MPKAAATSSVRGSRLERAEDILRGPGRSTRSRPCGPWRSFLSRVVSWSELRLLLDALIGKGRLALQKLGISQARLEIGLFAGALLHRHHYQPVEKARLTGMVHWGRLESYGGRSMVMGKRYWRGNAAERAAVYGNRRRIRGKRGKLPMRKRAEKVERSFAHCHGTGGMRRTHLRGHPEILKRLLMHASAFNLDLLMRKLFGLGTPRALAGLLGPVVASEPAVDGHQPPGEALRVGTARKTADSRNVPGGVDEHGKRLFFNERPSPSVPGPCGPPGWNRRSPVPELVSTGGARECPCTRLDRWRSTARSRR